MVYDWIIAIFKKYDEIHNKENHITTVKQIHSLFHSETK